MANTTPSTRSVLRYLDTDQLAEKVRQETRSRQRVLPPISTYRWWARRTRAVSGALLDAIARDQGGKRLFVADPFAGGGVIALSALLAGHRVYAQDVNPWAARNLVTMLTLPPPELLSEATDRLGELVADLVEKAYATTMADGTPGVISETLRVAAGKCPGCDEGLRLFPTALVSLTERVDCGGKQGFMACRAGHLTFGPTHGRMRCEACADLIDPTTHYTSGRRVKCHACGWAGKTQEVANGGLSWSVALVERVGPQGREIGIPSDEERSLARDERWAPKKKLSRIERGQETTALLGHGMRHWHELYPARQRVVIEALLSACPKAADGDEQVERALEAAVIGSAEMAGYVSRWDARYLKAYETVANHRYNFTTFAAEPNVWGAGEYGRGSVQRRLELLAKAALWLEEKNGRRLRVEGPVESSSRRSPLAKKVDARVVVGSSERLCIPRATFDAIVTDPPYHDDVQYSELSDLFRAWAGCGTGRIEGDAVAPNRGADAFEAYETRLRLVFTEMRRTLRPGGHLVLSYANRDPRAWAALLGALQTAEFCAVGYAVVPSENETDHAKSGRRACNLDVLLDLVADPGPRLCRLEPVGEAASDEEDYCWILGAWALKIGSLKGDWRQELVSKAVSSAFLAPQSL